MYQYDNRSPFERYCRQKGTRIDAIMTRLERGEDERELADRYHTGIETIRVYRKALEGKLTSGHSIDSGTKRSPETTKALIIILHMAGKGPVKIARQLGMPCSTVRSIIRRMKEREK